MKETKCSPYKWPQLTNGTKTKEEELNAFLYFSVLSVHKYYFFILFYDTVFIFLFFIFCGSVIVCRKSPALQRQRNYIQCDFYFLLHFAFDSLALRTVPCLLLAIYRMQETKNKTDFILLWLFGENRSSAFSSNARTHTDNLILISVVVWSWPTELTTLRIRLLLVFLHSCDEHMPSHTVQ